MYTKDKIAVQLNSLRKELAKDCETTIKTLKEIGFNSVQIDDTSENPKEEIAEIVKQYNMKIAGIHIKHERFFNNIDGIVQDAELFGTKNIVNKYIDDEYQSSEGYRFTRNTLRIIAKQLEPTGYRIGLHNSEYDLNKTVDGKRIMDFMAEEKKNIQIYPEFDTYWISVAGFDPVSYIKQFSNQIPIIHLKDFKPGLESYNMKNNQIRLGEGIIDFTSIIEWGEKNGINYYVIEQNHSKGNIFDCLEASYQHFIQVSEKIYA